MNPSIIMEYSLEVSDPRELAKWKVLARGPDPSTARFFVSYNL